MSSLSWKVVAWCTWILVFMGEGGIQAQGGASQSRGSSYWYERYNVFDSDCKAGDVFGSSACISGGWAAVGASHDDLSTWNKDYGSVSVYRNTPSGWVPEAKLMASDGESHDWFGSAVALDGDHLIVGAPGVDQGAVLFAGAAYTFRWTGAAWVEEQKLTKASAEYLDSFGISVSVSGNRAVVGIYFDDSAGLANAGRADVFEWDGQAWVLQTSLYPSDAAPGWLFGSAVSISGDRILVGAIGVDDGSTIFAGAAYVFDWNGTSWVEGAKLMASDPSYKADFGRSVSLCGDSCAVGGWHNDSVGDSAGSVYVFRRDSSGWVQDVKLRSTITMTGDYFGSSISLVDDMLIVGEPGEGNALNDNHGCAWLFRRTGGTWERRCRLVASDWAAHDNLGKAVSTDGRTVFVGASGDDPLNRNAAGSVYIYGPPGCPFCQGSVCPCGNDDPMAGCVSSLGHGARAVATRSPSVVQDDLRFGGERLPPGAVTMLLAGTPSIGGPAGTPFGDGLLRLRAPIRRLGVGIASAAGRVLYGPGLVAAGEWSSGEEIGLQLLYRDLTPSPCNTSYNLTDGIAIELQP